MGGLEGWKMKGKIMYISNYIIISKIKEIILKIKNKCVVRLGNVSARLTI